METEAGDIKRCQEYTEELYKKDLQDPDNYDGVVTHLEPDVLEYEVRWASDEVMRPEAMISVFFIVQLSHKYTATGKTVALTRQTFVGSTF